MRHKRGNNSHLKTALFVWLILSVGMVFGYPGPGDDSGPVIVDTTKGLTKSSSGLRTKVGSGISYDDNGNMVTVSSPIVQGGIFSVVSGHLTATITLPTPITTTYAVVAVLQSPVTILTVDVTRTSSFDVSLEWNGSGAVGYWVAVKY